MTTKNNLIAFLALFASVVNVPNTSYGQNTIKGRVTDTKGDFIEYANVVLLSSIDSTFFAGVVTDSIGFFQIAVVDYKSYIMKCSFIGYDDYFQNVYPSADLLNIRLNMSTNILDEISVVGHKKIFSVQKGVFTMDVQNTILKSIGNGIDVLNKLPSVITDNEDNIMVIGKGSPLIYINGRQVYDNSELQRLNSNDIQTVEHIEIPGSQYDGEIKSVIRIITVKKNKETGFAFRGRLNGQQGNNFSNNESLEFNYKIDKIDFRLSLYDYLSRKSSTGTYNTILHSDTVWNMNEFSKGYSKYAYNNIAANIYYEINNKHNINLSYNFSRGHPYSNNSNTTKVYANNYHNDNLINNSRINEKSTDNRFSILYNAELASKTRLNVNFDLYQKNTKLDQENNEVSDFGNRTVNSQSKAEYKIWAGKSTLTQKISDRISLTSGVDITHTFRNGNFKNEQSILPETKTNITQNKQSVFIDVSSNMEKISITAGLRYEHFHVKQIDVLDFNENLLLDKNYHIFLPSLAVSYPIDKVELSLALSRKTRRPTYYQLREGVQYNGRFEYDKGNPFLLPERTTMLSLSSNWNNLYLSAGYNVTSDYIGITFLKEEKSSGIKTSSHINYNRLSYFNIVANYSRNIKFWIPQISLNCIIQNFEIKYKESQKRLNNPYFMAKFTNDFRTKRGYILTVDFVGNTSGNIGETYLYSQLYCSISARKSFLNNNLDLSLRFNDIWKGMKRHSMNEIDFVKYQRDQYSDTRYISFTLTYKINNYKSRQKTRLAGDEEINRTF